MEECKYNISMLGIALLVTGSLFYFSLKWHFTLVLRSYWKEKVQQIKYLIDMVNARNAEQSQGGGQQMKDPDP